MLKFLLPIATALFAVPFPSALPAQAQEVPQLQMGMPYAEARQLILNEGWQPTYNAPEPDRVGISTRRDHLQSLGYTEIVDCAGTGMGLCRAEFQGDRLQTLVVTMGTGVQTDVVYQWWVEE